MAGSVAPRSSGLHNSPETSQPSFLNSYNDYNPSSLTCWYLQPSIWAGKCWIKHKETCAGTMKTLHLKFLVVLAMTCLAQKTMWFEAGPSGAKAWHPALPGLPGTAETPRGWSPVPAVGTWGSWGFPACVAPSDSAQKCLSSPGAVSTLAELTACFWGLGRSCCSYPYTGGDSHGVDTAFCTCVTTLWLLTDVCGVISTLQWTGQ